MESRRQNLILLVLGMIITAGLVRYMLNMHVHEGFAWGIGIIQGSLLAMTFVTNVVFIRYRSRPHLEKYFNYVALIIHAFIVGMVVWNFYDEVCKCYIESPEEREDD